MCSLSGADVIQELQGFFLDAEIFPSKLYKDFDKRTIQGGSYKWIIANKLKIVATPAASHCKNGLVEWTWISLLETSHYYLTEKQMPR